MGEIFYRRFRVQKFRLYLYIILFILIGLPLISQINSEKTVAADTIQTVDITNESSKANAIKSGNLTCLGGMTWIDHTSRIVDFGVDFDTNDGTTPQLTWKVYNISENTWTTVAENVSNWITYNFTSSGEYLVYVEGYNSNGKLLSYDIGWQISPLTLKLGGLTWQNQSNDLTDFGVAYLTNDVDAKFDWEIYDIANKTWLSIAEDALGNWVTIEFPHFGEYLVHVSVSTASGLVETINIGWQVRPSSLVINGLTWKNEKNDLTDFGVAYITDAVGVVFEWQIYDIAKNSWISVVQNATGNWVTIKFPNLGEYLVHVSISTTSGVTKTEDIGWQVKAALNPTYFSQLDNRWSGLALNDSTVGLSGCVPTSLAMVLNGSYGVNVNPGDVALQADQISNYYYGLTGKDLINLTNSYGYNAVETSDKNDLISALNAGYPVIFYVNVGVGHAVVAYGYNSGYTTVYDPMGQRFYSFGPHPLNSLWNSISEDTADWDAGLPVFVIK